MELIDNLKRELEKKTPQIKLRGFSFIDNKGRAVWAEIKATNIVGNPIGIETPKKDVDFGMQLLNVTETGTYQRGWRLDTAHQSLHSHSGSFVVSPEKAETFGDTLNIFLGEVPYKELLNQTNQQVI